MSAAAAAPQGGPGEEVIRRIILRASRAGSANNMQPWRFRWDGQVLSLHFDPDAEPSALNPDGLLSCLTFGGLLEHLELSALGEDLAMTAETTVVAATRELSARLRFAPAADAAADVRALLEGMATRFTDRRPFGPVSLGDPIFDAVRADAARYPGCGLHLRAGFTPELEGYILESEMLRWHHRPAHAQVMSGFRWTPEDVEQTATGTPAITLGLNPVVAQILKACRYWPVQVVLNRFGFATLAARKMRQLFDASPALIMITAKGLDHARVVEAGKLGARLWLRLHAASFGVHPLTSGSLFAYTSRANVVPPDFPAHMRALCAGGDALLRRVFPMPDGEIPVWLLRVGRSQGPIPQGWYTRRYPLERIFRPG
jgi:hypothetical protein